MSHPESNQRRTLILAGLLALPVLAIGWYIAIRPQPQLPQAENDLTLNARGTEKQIGGVPRPASDIAQVTNVRSRDRNLKSVGKTPRIKADANESTKSLVQAIRDKKHPSRLSPVFKAEPFDLVAYKKNPKAYLDIHEPARVWQSAQPGDGVPVLKAVAGSRHSMRQGESVRLSVKTAPNMPVTFTSFDLGLFANGLTSISVAANDQGVAEAPFFASPGTVGEVNVLAGSPVAAEHVRFSVFVHHPGLVRSAQ